MPPVRARQSFTAPKPNPTSLAFRGSQVVLADHADRLPPGERTAHGGQGAASRASGRGARTALSAPDIVRSGTNHVCFASLFTQRAPSGSARHTPHFAGIAGLHHGQNTQFGTFQARVECNAGNHHRSGGLWRQGADAPTPETPPKVETPAPAAPAALDVSAVLQKVSGSEDLFSWHTAREAYLAGTARDAEVDTALSAKEAELRTRPWLAGERCP